MHLKLEARLGRNHAAMIHKLIKVTQWYFQILAARPRIQDWLGSLLCLLVAASIPTNPDKKKKPSAALK